MRKTFTRGLSLALVLLMLLALAAPALAANKTMIVTATSAQVRSTPSQSGNNVVGKLMRHELVTQTGTTGVFAIIEFEGKTAYVLSASLGTYRGSSTPPSGGIIVDPDYGSGSSSGSGSSDAVTVYTTGTANVRKGPGTSYSKIAQLKKGAAVKQIGTTGSWAIIEWNDGVAYISRSLLTSSGSSGGSSGGNTGSSGTVTATANVNVRSGPGTSYSILGWLAKGESATKTGTSGSWTIISYKGSKGYVSSSYLTGGGSSGSGGGTATGQMLYANVYTAVRYGPGYSFRAAGYLDPGQRVEYLGKDGSWYRVRYGSYTNVYVYSGDVRFSGSGDPGYNASGYVYADTTVRVYETTSTSSAVLGYLYRGESATRTGVYGSFTRIRYRGGTGFVLTSQVSYSSSGGSSSGGSMSLISEWRYSRYDDVACYTVPEESRQFYHGRLGLNERVWAIEGNSTWTKIQVSGYTVYTRTSNLTNGYTGGYPWYPGGGSGTSRYAYVYAGTQVYSNSSGQAFLNSAGNPVTFTVRTMVRVVGAASNIRYVEVQFSYRDSDGTDRTTLGYVRQSDIENYY